MGVLAAGARRAATGADVNWMAGRVLWVGCSNLAGDHSIGVEGVYMIHRHATDGEPYYCEVCGATYGQDCAGDETECKLETRETAQERRERALERWREGMRYRRVRR